MQFGVVGAVEDAAWIKEAGADFLESLVQPVLKPAEEAWSPPVDPGRLPLPLAAYNVFFPAALKITGPDADLDRIRAWSARAAARAARMRSEVIVFGSGGARSVPDGWPRRRAEEQLIEAMRAIGPVARAQGITIAMEPLRRAESNILNTVAEGLDLIRRAAAPGVAVLCDFYHLAVENEPLAHLDAAGPLLAHVHIAEPEGRVPPQPGKTDYRPFLAKLKAIGYDRRISIECKWQDMRRELGPALGFLRGEWAAA